VDCKLVVNLEWKLVENRVEKSCTLGYIQKVLNVTKVEQLMNDHLNTQGKSDLRGGLYSFGVQTKLEPLLLAHMAHQKSSKVNSN
jgi:hypothetical protein